MSLLLAQLRTETEHRLSARVDLCWFRIQQAYLSFEVDASELRHCSVMSTCLNMRLGIRTGGIMTGRISAVGIFTRGIISVRHENRAWRWTLPAWLRRNIAACVSVYNFVLRVFVLAAREGNVSGGGGLLQCTVCGRRCVHAGLGLLSCVSSTCINPRSSTTVPWSHTLYANERAAASDALWIVTETVSHSEQWHTG